MKIYLILLLSVIVFYGCGKKSNPNPTIPPTIIGKWYENRSIFQEFLNNQGQPIQESAYTDTGQNIQFFNNGTGVSSEGNGGVYLLTKFNWSVSGIQLTISDETDTILNLTNSSLEIHERIIANDIGDNYQYVTNSYYSK